MAIKDPHTGGIYISSGDNFTAEIRVKSENGVIFHKGWRAEGTHSIFSEMGR